MDLFVDEDGVKRLWVYWVVFFVIEFVLCWFGFKWFYWGYGFFIRFVGVTMLFVAVFGFAFLFFGDYISDQLNSVVYK